jgi:hypothetical protein
MEDNIHLHFAMADKSAKSAVPSALQNQIEFNRTSVILICISIEGRQGAGAVCRQTQPIEIQACIPAPWRNGLWYKVFRR